MIAVVDYGVGNLFSLAPSLKKVGADFIITGDANVIANAEKIILPGVGAFEDAIDKLRASGLDRAIKDAAEKGKYILGICLGMQLLFDISYEYGTFEGLGLIKGTIRPLTQDVPENLKVPHIGWNALNIVADTPVLKYLKNGDFVYFVHSYHATECTESVIATTEYGAEITAAVANKNVMGMQFHPEKSGNTGLSILKAFNELEY